LRFWQRHLSLPKTIFLVVIMLNMDPTPAHMLI
jgi:hypothetical protein